MAGNAKPFDQAFKALAELDPRRFLEVMGVLDASVDAEAELLPQELVLSAKSIDVSIEVRPRDGEAFVAIFEAFAVFHPRSFDQVVEYNKALDSKTELALRTYMVPLVERACPAGAPRTIKRRKGGYGQRVDLTWIRPWEIDAGILLEQGQPEFDAWTALFRWTEAQQAEALRRLRDTPDQFLRYTTLGGLRYRGSEASGWKEFLERTYRMITREDLRESLFIQEWLEEGRQEGRQEGHQQGRQAGLWEMLRFSLMRFPAITLPADPPPGLDLSQAGRDVALAADEAAARAALAAHGLLPRQ